MTMHYELKGKHEVCFKANIGLTGQLHSTYRIYGASETEKNPPRLPLNIGIWTAVRRTPRKDDIDRNNKLNNKIEIISMEQTAVSAVQHTNRHVALASSVFKTRLLVKPVITLFFAFVQPPYF